MTERNLEEEHFARLEREKLLKLKAKQEAEERARMLAERKALHYHKCGKCGDDMETKPFRGVEIEVCPSCGAVLLDAGELEILAGEDQGGMLASLFDMFGRGAPPTTGV